MLKQVITSAKEDIIMPDVCMYVCLPVTNFALKLLNGSARKFYHKGTDVSMHKEELIKYCESSASGSESRNF